jgi:hypothetical protein
MYVAFYAILIYKCSRGQMSSQVMVSYFCFMYVTHPQLRNSTVLTHQNMLQIMSDEESAAQSNAVVLVMVHLEI